MNKIPIEELTYDPKAFTLSPDMNNYEYNKSKKKDLLDLLSRKCQSFPINDVSLIQQLKIVLLLKIKINSLPREIFDLLIKNILDLYEYEHEFDLLFRVKMIANNWIDCARVTKGQQRGTLLICETQKGFSCKRIFRDLVAGISFDKIDQWNQELLRVKLDNKLEILFMIIPHGFEYARPVLLPAALENLTSPLYKINGKFIARINTIFSKYYGP